MYNPNIYLERYWHLLMYKGDTTWENIKLLAKFRQLAADTRIPAARLLDEAIEDLLVKYNVITKEEKKNP